MALEQIINQFNIAEEVGRLGQEIDQIVEAGGEAKVTTVTKATRTKSMNALWWGFWIPQTAEWMNNNGARIEVKNQHGKVIHTRQVEPDDAHAMFVSHWLGATDKGLRELTRDMQKSRFLFMMDKHSHWAVEKGLLLTYPEDSEYSRLKRQTEE